MAKLKRFVICLIAGAAAAAGVLYLNRGSGYGLPQRLSDACFVPAVLLLGWGGLGFANNHGFFDMIGYSVKKVFLIHYPSAGTKESADEELVDYKRRKAQKRRSPAGPLLAGLLYLVLATGMLILYFCT